MSPVAEQLRARLREANDDSEQVRAAYTWLKDEVGGEEASRLWWDAFAATDASET